MVFEPNVLRSESAHIDHPEEICFSRLYADSQILGIVQQCCLRYGFCARRIGDVDEFCEKVVHKIMIPIRKRYDNFFVVEIFVWIFRIMYNKRTSNTIWILAALMAVIPICARLVDLY
jgi:hypothetical protein